MARQIFEDYRVARAQHGEEDLLDIGKETLSVDRPIECKRRNQGLRLRVRTVFGTKRTSTTLAECVYATVFQGFVFGSTDTAEAADGVTYGGMVG
jgi:hypothetical protein